MPVRDCRTLRLRVQRDSWPSLALRRRKEEEEEEEEEEKAKEQQVAKAKAKQMASSSAAASVRPAAVSEASWDFLLSSRRALRNVSVGTRRGREGGGGRKRRRSEYLFIRQSTTPFWLTALVVGNGSGMCCAGVFALVSIVWFAAICMTCAVLHVLLLDFGLVSVVYIDLVPTAQRDTQPSSCRPRKASFVFFMTVASQC